MRSPPSSSPDRSPQSPQDAGTLRSTPNHEADDTGLAAGQGSQRTQQMHERTKRQDALAALGNSVQRSERTKSHECARAGISCQSKLGSITSVVLIVVRNSWRKLSGPCHMHTTRLAFDDVRHDCSQADMNFAYTAQTVQQLCQSMRPESIVTAPLLAMWPPLAHQAKALCVTH